MSNEEQDIMIFIKKRMGNIYNVLLENVKYFLATNDSMGEIIIIYIFFAGFRTMIYCDECHDFITHFKSTKSEDGITFYSVQNLSIDIKWYRDTISSYLDINKGKLDYLKDNLKKDGQRNPNWMTDFELFYEIIYTLEYEPETTQENYASKLILRLKQLENEKAKNNGLIKRNRQHLDSPYIQSDEIAKNISDIILEKLFLIKKQPLGQDKDLCYLHNKGINELLKRLYRSVYLYDEITIDNWNNIGFGFTIDQEGKSKNTIEVVNSIRSYEKNHQCKDIGDIFSNVNIPILSTINDISQDSDQPSALFTTNANQMDPGEGAFEKLRSLLRNIVNIDQPLTNTPQLNIKNTIKFGTIPIIIYKYEIPRSDNNFNNAKFTLYQFCNFIYQEESGITLTKNKVSVKEVSDSIDTLGLNNNHVRLTFFKTFGDLNQVIQFAAYLNDYKKYINQTNLVKLGTLENYILFFLTGDISCGNFSGLLTQNSLSEYNSTHIFGGLLVYLNMEEKQLWEQMIQNIEQFPEIIDILDQVGIDDPEVMDELSPKQKRKHGNSFGKYKKNRKQSKQRKQSTRSKQRKQSTRSKQSTRKTEQNKKTSKKLEKLKKEVKKMGLSKNILKLTSKKLEEKINKLKNLAKKYRLKVTKKLISNIKKCIKIHENAKKLKIKLTKVTKSGKRLYKTPNELLKEIKKIKGIKKTKQ